MRILVVGMGGAGCRILESLFHHDRKSMPRSIDGIALDRDADALNSLKVIPPGRRLFFQPLDPEKPTDLLASVPAEEVLARLHAMDDGDIDAIFICAGLGGILTDAVSEISGIIRKGMVEPIFGLFTLPCRSEGATAGIRAVDQLDQLAACLDGVILFDNDLWRGKTAGWASPPAATLAPDLDFFIPRRGNIEPEDPRLKVFWRINEVIAQMMTLLLQAGEHSERSPDDLPEVVLDAGEILNTIQGMHYISIGYACEPLPEQPRGILRLIPRGLPVDESHKKAQRVVDLTKKAIFDEISTRTNLEDAEKALVLISGPVQEMSMRGFMTVRRWIDRTIRGFELRSGDYPQGQARSLAVIVLLAGMQTIPRVAELRALRGGAPGGDPEGGDQTIVPGSCPPGSNAEDDRSDQAAYPIPGETDGNEPAP